MRKIAYMYQRFGRDPEHKCIQCVNFVSGQKWNKCKRYGLTHSAATDWSAKTMACGAFNKPIDYRRENPVRVIAPRAAAEKEPEIPGQLSMF